MATRTAFESNYGLYHFKRFCVRIEVAVFDDELCLKRGEQSTLQLIDEMFFFAIELLLELQRVFEFT